MGKDMAVQMVHIDHRTSQSEREAFGEGSAHKKGAETSGFPNVCESREGVTLPYVLHAEANAITKVARSNNSSEGSTLYVTASPCMECSKLIWDTHLLDMRESGLLTGCALWGSHIISRV